jgi:hypothetical protein
MKYQVKKAAIITLIIITAATICWYLQSYTSCLSQAERSHNYDIDCMLAPAPVSNFFTWIAVVFTLLAIVGISITFAFMLLNRTKEQHHKKTESLIILALPINILLAALMFKLLYVLPYNNWNYTEVIAQQIVGWAMIIFAALALASIISYITYKAALHRERRT